MLKIKHSVFKCLRGVITLFFLSPDTGQPSLLTKKQVQAVAGSSLTISCSYPCKYFTYQKYWCKWKNTECKPLISSEQNQTGLVVSCDKDNGILSLNFDQVTSIDQGWYWCGVKHGQQYGETAALQLQVQGGESKQ